MKMASPGARGKLVAGVSWAGVQVRHAVGRTCNDVVDGPARRLAATEAG